MDRSPNGTHHRAAAAPPPRVLYLASALGAFVLGLGDYFRNEYASTTMRMGEFLTSHFHVGGEPMVFAFVLLMILAVIGCWVYQPPTKVDAFARGLSVLSLLSLASPATGPQSLSGKDAASPGGPGGSLLGIEEAFADAPVAYGSMTLRFVAEDGRAPVAREVVTLRAASTAQLLGRERLMTDSVRIERPLGRYLVEIEAPGFQRVQAALEIGSRPACRTISLRRSAVPIAVQRFYAPAVLHSQVRSTR